MSLAQNVSSDLELEKILRQIETEPLESVCAREQSAFDRIAGPFSQRLVLFGAGPLGKGILSGLRRAGVEPVAFADNNEKLWGKQVSGLPVLSPNDAIAAYGEVACFVVTIYQGSSVRSQLASLGCSRIAPFASLLWKYSDIFVPQNGIDLPHRLKEQCEAIRMCHAALADEASKRELREQLVWRYWLDYTALSPALNAHDTYFPMDLLSPNDEEVFVDCGGFDGDTIRGFSDHWRGSFRHVFAFEPDPANRTILVANVKAAGLSGQVTVLPFAVGNKNGPVSFTCTSSASSHVATMESGIPVECRRLDDLDWSLIPTYIKMDIESAEPEALAGAAELLRRHQPVLAVCTYHRGEHLWQIPNLIHSISSNYRIFLRRYAQECWEGVCYAVPHQRLRSSDSPIRLSE